jgi:hypothetical protein
VQIVGLIVFVSCSVARYNDENNESQTFVTMLKLFSLHNKKYGSNVNTQIQIEGGRCDKWHKLEETTNE